MTPILTTDETPADAKLRRYSDALDAWEKALLDFARAFHRLGRGEKYADKRAEACALRLAEAYADADRRRGQLTGKVTVEPTSPA